MKKVWEFLKKLQMELSDDPASPLLSVYSTELRGGHEEVSAPRVQISGLIPRSQEAKAATQMPISTQTNDIQNTEFT